MLLPSDHHSLKKTTCLSTREAHCHPGGTERRPILAGMLAIGLCALQGLALIPAYAQIGRKEKKAETDPTRLPPQPGDRFTYFYGDRKGEVIRPDDVPLASKQMLVYPVDPLTGTIREGSRLNMVLLIRFPPEQLDERTQANAAEGGRCLFCDLYPPGLPGNELAQRPSNAFLSLSQFRV